MSAIASNFLCAETKIQLKATDAGGFFWSSGESARETEVENIDICLENPGVYQKYVLFMEDNS